MINTSVNKNEHTIQSGVVDYLIGFPFYFNPDRTPQLLVKIGDEELRFNHNFELSEDNGSVVLRPTEEESWTLEGPEDFSWMTKWDGKDLLIERAVPFVQDSDYQLGRISSEQIERDFDLSVMRDQALAQADEDIATEVALAKARISANEGNISWLDGKASELENAISEEAYNRVHDDGILLEKIEQLNERNEDYREELQRGIDDKLPLGGGTLTGPLTIKVDATYHPILSLKNEKQKTFDFYVNDTEMWMNFKIGQVEGISPAGYGTNDLGDSLYRWRTVYAKGLSNGAGQFIAIPEKSGTVACLDDIPETYTKEELDIKFAEIPDAVDAYTKAEVDAKLSSVYKFKGSVANVEALPSGAVVGDTYNVEDTGANYAWDGSNWDKLSDTIDLSGYATVDYAEELYNELNEKISDGAEFPDQTGNAGKVLQTNGSEVSWSLGTIIFPRRTASYDNDGSVIITGDGYQQLKEIGRGSIIIGGSLFGQTPTVQNTTVIGVGSYAKDEATAIGYRAGAMGRHSIQLGEGVNSDANTFKVSNENGNFEMMSTDGTVPTDRYTTTPATAGTYVPKLTIAEDGTATREWGAESGGGGDTIQFEQLPTPSADYVGKILQYVGEDGTYKSGHFYKCVETVEIISGGYTMDGSSITVTVDTDKFLAQNPVWADYGTPMWRADGGANGWNVFTQDPSLSLTDDELRNTWGVAVNGEDGNPYTGYSASISIQQGGTTYLWTEVDFSGEGPDLSNYLQLSGGTMTGPITLEWSGAGTATNFVSIKSKYTNTSAGTTYSYNLLQFTPSGSAVFYGDITAGNLVPKTSGVSIGSNTSKWFRVHTQSLYNGGVLKLPTTAGTIARVEDIDAAVGDISTALTAIIGE